MRSHSTRCVTSWPKEVACQSVLVGQMCHTLCPKCQSTTSLKRNDHQPAQPRTFHRLSPTSSALPQSHRQSWPWPLASRPRSPRGWASVKRHKPCNTDQRPVLRKISSVQSRQLHERSLGRTWALVQSPRSGTQ